MKIDMTLSFLSRDEASRLLSLVPLELEVELLPDTTTKLRGKSLLHVWGDLHSTATMAKFWTEAGQK